MKTLTPSPWVLALVLIGGCTHYGYDLVRPPDLARHVGSKEDAVFEYAPLTYRLRAVENRLVMRIFNPTGDPITLVGERSYAVDPGGQSHPLRGQTIAPNTFIKLILPPMRPYYYESSPNFGFGLGLGFGSVYRRPWGYYPWGYPGYYPYYYDEPRYITYYDESDATYWDWEGQTDARIHLVFHQGQKMFEQEFLFHRVKEQ